MFIEYRKNIENMHKCGCIANYELVLFIFLMSGTYIIYHWPMRPTQIKYYNYTIKTISTINNIQGKYESSNSKD